MTVAGIDAGGWIITTVAGSGEQAHGGDGGPAVQAALLESNDVALSADERLLYIADPSDHRVRVVDLHGNTIDTFAGTGAARDFGNGGPATEAGVHGARAVAVAVDGSVYIGDSENYRLRKVTRAG